MNQKKLLFDDINNNLVNQTSQVAGRFTLVSLSYKSGDKHVIGYGIARRSDLDKYSEVKGKEIARGRALRSIYNKITFKYKKNKNQELFVD